MTLAVLLVDHGSRRADAHEGLTWAGGRLEQILVARGAPSSIVEIAHMELCAPSIAEGYQRCVQRGATRVLVIPCFLSRGRHVSEDIPAQAAAAAAQFPLVHYQLSPPLLELDGFIEMLAAYVEASA